MLERKRLAAGPMLASSWCRAKWRASRPPQGIHISQMLGPIQSKASIAQWALECGVGCCGGALIQSLMCKDREGFPKIEFPGVECVPVKIRDAALTNVQHNHVACHSPLHLAQAQVRCWSASSSQTLAPWHLRAALITSMSWAGRLAGRP